MLSALIVDSSAEFGEEAKALLESCGFEVELASSGQEGLTKARDRRYRLVCCADNLDDLSSSEFSGVLRSINGYEFTTLLILTGNDDSKVLKQSLLAGATDVFQKDDLTELENYLRRLSQRETKLLNGRVLFIEDSRVVQTIMIDLLTDMGLDVDSYDYAESAWDAFQAGDYDLVITDIMLEGAMSGISLVRKIRRLESDSANVPIIATSGFDNISRKIELFHLGVNDYVSKPVVREELRQRVFNHVTSYQNLCELRAQQQSLFSLAMLDEVTGLFNRHALREFANKHFSEAYRFDHTLSIAVLDIDQMKQINETVGYDKGNQMLSELGTWLKRHMRDVDIAARWAGDELIFILPGCDEANAFELMKKVQNRIRRLKPAGLNMTCSIGVAEIRSDEKDNLSSLFELADKAMYHAKLSGRDCVAKYSDIEANNALDDDQLP